MYAIEMQVLGQVYIIIDDTFGPKLLANLLYLLRKYGEFCFSGLFPSDLYPRGSGVQSF